MSIDNIQFVFIPGKGTTDAIIIRKKKLYHDFGYIEKAFDRVPREVVRWILRKLVVVEWLIRTVMALYPEDCTVVRTYAGLNESFELKVGLHQVSLLSHWLLLLMLSSVRREVVGLSELLYADVLVLMAPTMEQLGRRVAE